MDGEVDAEMVDSGFATLKYLANEHVSLLSNASRLSKNEAAWSTVETKSAVAASKMELFEDKPTNLLCL